MKKVLSILLIMATVFLISCDDKINKNADVDAVSGLGKDGYVNQFKLQ